MSSAQPGGSSLRDQRAARTHDREVAPVWHDRFGRLMFRDLSLRPKTVALDIHSASGRVTSELLQRLDESSRVLALESDPALVTLAKQRLKPEWKNRVYFKPGNFDDVTTMGDDTYDLTVANLVLGEEVHDWRAALVELLRVTKPGGQFVATLPLYGTWCEVEDLFEEILRDYQLRDAIRMLQQVRRMRPRPRAVGDALMEAGVEPEDFVVEHDQFQLLFRSGREFLFAPVIEQGPLRVWKAILGKAKDPQKLFWRFKESIDAYYAGRTLAVTVLAGVIRVRLPDGKSPRLADEYWSRFPELDRVFKGDRITPPSEDEDEDFELDIEMDDEEEESTAVVAAEPAAEEEDDIDTDAIFAALEATDDEQPTDDLDNLDAAFGDTFDMTQEMSTAAVMAALQQDDGDEETNTAELMDADDLAEFDELEGLFEEEAEAEAETKPKPAPKVSKPPPTLSKPKTATGSTTKIPPPPPTGAHKKLNLPPLPKPKKKKS